MPGFLSDPPHDPATPFLSFSLSFSIWNMGSSVSLPPVGKDDVRQVGELLSASGCPALGLSLPTSLDLCVNCEGLGITAVGWWGALSQRLWPQPWKLLACVCSSLISQEPFLPFLSGRSVTLA